MPTDIATSNNQIIEAWTPPYIERINASKRSFGIKHRRVRPALRSKANLKKNGGEITKISVSMTKGEIMSHKGAGKYPANRTDKPWFTPITGEDVNDLANQIATNTGDIIALGQI